MQIYDCRLTIYDFRSSFWHFTSEIENRYSLFLNQKIANADLRLSINEC
jgi:hypothetical protein